MTAPNLTERYLDAAMRSVPEPQREDLTAELRTSIADQVEARIDAGENRDDAERAVLTDLGDPDKLAAQYTDRQLHLLGPRYFLDWWRLMKLLLWIVIPSVTFAVALGTTIAGSGVGGVLGTLAVVLLHTVVHLFFWTTLVFVLVERFGSNTTSEALVAWDLDQLPEPTHKSVSLGDTIGTLVWLAIFAGIVLWDQFIGFAPGDRGLSFFDAGLWPVWILGLLAIIAAWAILTLVVHAAGRWTPALAAISMVLALVFAIPALWLLVQGRLLNPDFWPTLIQTGDSGVVTTVVTIVTGFTIAGVAIWDVVDSLRKVRRG